MSKNTGKCHNSMKTKNSRIPKHGFLTWAQKPLVNFWLKAPKIGSRVEHRCTEETPITPVTSSNPGTTTFPMMWQILFFQLQERTITIEDWIKGKRSSPVRNEYLCPRSFHVTMGWEVISHDGVADELDIISQHSQSTLDCGCQSCHTQFHRVLITKSQNTRSRDNMRCTRYSK